MLLRASDLQQPVPLNVSDTDHEQRHAVVSDLLSWNDGVVSARPVRHHHHRLVDAGARAFGGGQDVGVDVKQSGARGGHAAHVGGVTRRLQDGRARVVGVQAEDGGGSAAVGHQGHLGNVSVDVELNGEAAHEVAQGVEVVAADAAGGVQGEHQVDCLSEATWEKNKEIVSPQELSQNK